MADTGDRARYFPAIGEKSGRSAQHWLSVLEKSGLSKYPEQMALLQENHGFSRTHANALVMTFRGSASEKRFDSPSEYFASLDQPHRSLAERIIRSIQESFPELTLVMAWNQPILRCDEGYVFGVSASAGHLSINPFTPYALHQLAGRIEKLVVLKHTVQIPLDWEVDAALLTDMVDRRLRELEYGGKES